MKSYIQGLITGGVLVFTFMVLMGATDNYPNGRYQISAMEVGNHIDGGTVYMIDTASGELFFAADVTNGAGGYVWLSYPETKVRN